MTIVNAPYPFIQWGIDILGPFPLGWKQLKFQIVTIDSFIEWVEAELLEKITEPNVQMFVWRDIVCRLGLPKAIVTNKDKQFDNKSFRDFCTELRIKNYYSSLYYLQANRQVELAYQSLLQIIKTKLDDQGLVTSFHSK